MTKSKDTCIAFHLITYICAHCGCFAEVSLLSVEAFDSGTTLACDKCGKDTVFDLNTPEQRKSMWESLGRGFTEHEPDQTYGAADG